MAYFPNMSAWECWAAGNCFKCLHWPKSEDDAPCPVEMAHTLYSYELCNEEQHPGKIMLDMLIPETADGLGAEQCAMFYPSDAEEQREHKRAADRRAREEQDRQRYEAALRESRAA